MDIINRLNECNNRISLIEIKMVLLTSIIYNNTYNSLKDLKSKSSNNGGYNINNEGKAVV